MYGLKQYLLGRHFVIRTDHSALQWLRKTPEPMAQLARWLVFIEQFDFDVLILMCCMATLMGSQGSQ